MPFLLLPSFKRGCLILGLGLLAAVARAQTQYPDLLVTAKGDTVRCHFGYMRDSTIQYYRQGPDGNPQKKTVKKDTLKTFQRDFYSRREVDATGKIKRQPGSFYIKKTGRQTTSFRFYIGFETGLGVRSAPTTPDMVRYWKTRGIDPNLYRGYRIKTGSTLALSTGYMFKPWIGAGGRVEWFNTIGEPTSMPEIYEKANFVVVGPEITVRRPLGKYRYSHLFATIGIGPAWGNTDFMGTAIASTRLSGKGSAVWASGGLRIKIVDAIYLNVIGNRTWGGLNLPRYRSTVSHTGLSLGATVTL